MLYMAQEGALVFLPDFGETSNSYIDRCRQLMAIPTPEQWYRDAMWYLEQNDLRKALGFQPSDQTATRLQLAQAIALTAGELEPINQVSPAPDLYDDQWGCVDLTGKEIIPCRYESITTFHDYALAAGSAQSGYTLFDREGDVLGTVDGNINPNNTSQQFIQYQDPDTGLYGYLNRDGSVAVEAAYTAAYPYSYNYAAVRDGSGLAGFVDRTGKLVIPCQFETVAEGFNYLDYAVVGSGGLLGICNTAGELVIPMSYSSLGNFSGGLAPFVRQGTDGALTVGYLTTDGTEHFPDQLAGTLSLPFPYVNDTAIFEENGLYGLMDTQFQTVLPPAFPFALQAASGAQVIVEAEGMLFRIAL